MELRQLAYFKSVAEAGSFVRASEVLNIAQPALSAQTSKLEDQLGTKLFVRHPRGVWLTEAGHLFLAYAQKILASVHEAEQAMEAFNSDEPQGVVTIAMPTTIALAIAQPLLEEVQERMPKVSLQIVEALSGEIRRWYAADRFDLSILYHPTGASLDNAVPMCREDLYFLTQTEPGKPLAKTVRFEDVAKHPLHHTSRNHACRSLLDQTAEQTGIPLKIAAEIDSIQLLQDLVSQKKVASVFPCIVPMSGTAIAYQRIVDPGLQLQSHIAPARGRPVTKAQSALMRLMPRLAQDIADSRDRPDHFPLPPAKIATFHKTL